MSNRPNWVSQQLPPNAREALAKASQTPITEVDPKARIRAIEAAIATARANHPELFQPEGE